jgi:hypothetical protein
MTYIRLAESHVSKMTHIKLTGSHVLEMTYGLENGDVMDPTFTSSSVLAWSSVSLFVEILLHQSSEYAFRYSGFYCSKIYSVKVQIVLFVSDDIPLRHLWKASDTICFPLMCPTCLRYKNKSSRRFVKNWPCES